MNSTILNKNNAVYQLIYEIILEKQKQETEGEHLTTKTCIRVNDATNKALEALETLSLHLDVVSEFFIEALTGRTVRVDGEKAYKTYRLNRHVRNWYKNPSGKEE